MHKESKMTTDFNSPQYKAYLQDQQLDNVSGSYDSKYLSLLKKWKPDLEYQGKEILDIGTRTFDTWEYFLEHYSTEITGIDVGFEGIEYCKKHKKHGFIELDAHKMMERFDENTFDLVLAFHSFEHMFDLPLVIENCHKVLKPGGLLFWAIPIPSFNWGRGHWYDIPNERFAHQLCTHRGFKLLKTVTYRDLEIRPEVEMIALMENLA